MGFEAFSRGQPEDKVLLPRSSQFYQVARAGEDRMRELWLKGFQAYGLSCFLKNSVIVL